LAWQELAKSVVDAEQKFWPPLWVLCDGQDAEHTAYISTAVEVSDNYSKHNGSHSSSAIANGMANGNGTSTNGSNCSDQGFIIRSFCVNVTGRYKKGIPF
jgi:hypothetical protein